MPLQCYDAGVGSNAVARGSCDTRKTHCLCRDELRDNEWVSGTELGPDDILLPMTPHQVVHMYNYLLATAITECYKFLADCSHMYCSFV